MDGQIRIGGFVVPNPELLIDGPMSVNASALVCDNGDNDFSSCEPSILTEMDSYMEDLNARLIVSRMVTNSVFKGMVNAIEQECSEIIHSKDEMITDLNEKLQNRNEKLTDKWDLNQLSSEENPKINPISMESNSVFSHPTSMPSVTNFRDKDRLRIDIKTLSCEQKSERETQIDYISTMLQSLIAGLQHEYETNIYGKKILLNDLKEKWWRRMDKLTDLRLELDDLHKSFISCEPVLICSHASHTILEELKRKDQVHRKPVGNCTVSHDENTQITIKKTEESEKISITDSPQLLCMTKEELIHYFKTEMANMRRQHDVSLQEKTEELFSLKREFPREKGPCHLYFKKEKEVELMKKKIAETIYKLDGIISENESFSTILDEGLCSFREKIDGIFAENRLIVSLLAAKCSNDWDVSNQMLSRSVDLEHVNQIEELLCDIEGLKFEMSVKDEINANALRDSSHEFQDTIHDMKAETRIDQCIFSLILKEVVKDLVFDMNAIPMKYYDDKNYVSENLLEMTKSLCLEVDKNKTLNQQIESFSILLKMKEELALDLEAQLMRRSEQTDSILHERDKLREQVLKQEVIIAENKKESDLLNCRLEEKFHVADQQKAEIVEISQTLRIVSSYLCDAEKQMSILQSELALEVEKGKKQRKQVDSMRTSMLELCKYFEKMGHKIIDNVAINESRLKTLCHRNEELSQHVNLLKKKFGRCKEVFERRCEDLQKAEIEVDLLGDDVDNLISLLGKIYLALEHYSSVLQYYPGVMEILKMIRREIKDQACKSF